MEDVNKWLESYGLNPTEISVYTCILQYPDVKVSDIQLQTGLVRTTIYYTLSKLKAEGLISENTQNNVKTYRCSDAGALKRNIESDISAQKQKLDQLESLEDIFENIKPKNIADTSHVARYEGVEAVKKSIEEAFRCESKQWHVIASRDNFLYRMSKPYQQYYLKERKRRDIKAKTLWEPTGEAKSISIEDTFYRNPRVLPEEFHGTFNSLVILYDDTTLIVDSYSQKTAHAIYNPAGTNLMRLMFDTIWRSSKTIK